MNPKAGIILIALAVALGQQDPGRPATAAPLPPAAARVAKDFLFAFSRNDREAIKGMLPRRLENLYGPCPFSRMPALTKPRVDSRVAAIDFEGPMADSDLPRAGTMVLRLVEENGVRAWRVRQCYWYEELPRGANLPERSPTAADRRQEPKLRRAAVEFLEAWLAGDYDQMDELTFHWWNVPRRAPKYIKTTGANLTARKSTLEGLRVDFVLKGRIFRILPKSVRGTVWLVEEDGKWRVRPLTFSFFS